MSRSASSRISSDRVARTPVKEPGGTGHTGWITDEALLQMPQGQGRTEEEIALAEAAAALEALRAARTVTRYTMRLSHGCTGKGCRKRAHKPDMAVRDELLDMLQLKPGG